MTKKAKKKTDKKIEKKVRTKSTAAKRVKRLGVDDNTDTMAITDGSMKDVIRDAFLRRPI